MPHRCIGSVLHEGDEYVRPSHAGRMVGVSGSTITRWFNKGLLQGIYLPAKRGSRDVLYILKESLTENLHDFECMMCGKTVKTKRHKSRRQNRFCSDKCCNKWWNKKRPVNSNGVRKDRPNRK